MSPLPLRPDRRPSDDPLGICDPVSQLRRRTVDLLESPVCAAVVRPGLIVTCLALALATWMVIGGAVLTGWYAWKLISFAVVETYDEVIYPRPGRVAETHGISLPPSPRGSSRPTVAKTASAKRHRVNGLPAGRG